MSTSNLPTKADIALNCIRAIVQEALDAPYEQAMLKSKLDQIKQIALEANLAYVNAYPPKMVGIHPDNREGSGCSGVDMHELGAGIIGSGWSMEETKSACAFEDQNDKRGALFTVQLQRDSSLLPTQVLEEIKLLAVACCHTNQFLVAVEQGVETDKAILAIDGRMSRSKVVAKCHSMSEAFDHGLTWFIFKADAWAGVPKLPWLVQAAANKPGSIARKVTIFQAMVGMQGDIKEMTAADARNIIDHKLILARAANRSPHFDDHPGCLEWLKAYGGGASGFWLHELHTFVKECCKASCHVPGEWFEAVAAWPLPAGDRCETAACAILKAIAERGERSFKLGDIKKMAQHDEARAVLLAVDKAMKLGRQVLEDHL